MIILPLDSTQATLEIAGGKGANLALLSRAGFLVPRGFIISTNAYRSFIESNNLSDPHKRATPSQPPPFSSSKMGEGLSEKGGVAGGDANVVVSTSTSLNSSHHEQIERISAQIRTAFSKGKLPDEVEAAIQQLAIEFLDTPVAVRSSATTEDLPDLSFAGQQDTSLNVLGVDQLRKAVIDCWSSLWSARAIEYRINNAINEVNISIAVIIQEMVQSETSGVLFTANPLTGSLTEMVIDATFGLGEALVAGKVDPDHYVVNSQNGTINHKTLGEKQISIRSKTGGGIDTIQESNSQQQSLSENNIKQLISSGTSIQKLFGYPQDIEWAFAGGNLFILQSRAITSLFPIPEFSTDPLEVWFSFGAVQGQLEPMSPLGIDAIQHLVANAGGMFGLRLKPAQVKYFSTAGERIWIRISEIVRNPFGNKIFGFALEYIEPGVGQILTSLAGEPALSAGRGQLKISTIFRLAYFVFPLIPRFVFSFINPVKARHRFDQRIERSLTAASIPNSNDSYEHLTACIDFMRTQTASAFQFLLPHFIPILGPAMASLNILIKLSGDEGLAMDVTRGLPHNVTTEMDLALWNTATNIRSDQQAANIFKESDPAELAARFLNGALSEKTQSAIADFMEHYGMRGVGEIDFGQPRWREDPTPIMHTLSSYVSAGPEISPDAMFARGEKTALAAIESISAKVRAEPNGWLKEKIVRAAARRIRILMGARESPKFFAIRNMGIARKALLDVGNAFVGLGIIDKMDDLVYLTLDELAELKPSSVKLENSEEKKSSPINTIHGQSIKELIALRRARVQREAKRRQVPLVLVSDGRAIYSGLNIESGSGTVITGNPVSAGVVEGIVHIVFDPRNTQLTPGEILVCKGTDPAWTPLFMVASGLITEVGGMMTHGSVVAREYGIPAIVGVAQATSFFKNGQKIKMDGSSGKILIID